MTAPTDGAQTRLLTAAFRMPSIQTMTSRKTSITNAFVSAIIPSVRPSLEEIAEALFIEESTVKGGMLRRTKSTFHFRCPGVPTTSIGM